LRQAGLSADGAAHALVRSILLETPAIAWPLLATRAAAKV